MYRNTAFCSRGLSFLNHAENVCSTDMGCTPYYPHFSVAPGRLLPEPLHCSGFGEKEPHRYPPIGQHHFFISGITLIFEKLEHGEPVTLDMMFSSHTLRLIDRINDARASLNGRYVYEKAFPRSTPENFQYLMVQKPPGVIGGLAGEHDLLELFPLWINDIHYHAGQVLWDICVIQLKIDKDILRTFLCVYLLLSSLFWITPNRCILWNYTDPLRLVIRMRIIAEQICVVSGPHRPAMTAEAAVAGGWEGQPSVWLPYRRQ
jgi:hypothetical protein